MKNLFSLLLVSAFAASCINLNGQLNVTQTMNVKKKGGFLNMKTINVELEPGAYKSELKINSDKSFTLKLRADKEDEKDILIPIKSEKAFDLPANGPVRIAGNDISQPFNLNGTITTGYSDSSITRTLEDCTFTRNERHCEKVCNEYRDPRRPERRPEVRCDIICRDVAVTISGRRPVEYHYRYTHRNLEVEFNDINTQAQLATFSANGTESDRINDYYGECR
ncbi:MAG: hypothetical protein WC635_03275 [Bacteriovorax sp.]|jgi:hypothetical protein